MMHDKQLGRFRLRGAIEQLHLARMQVEGGQLLNRPLHVVNFLILKGVLHGQWILEVRLQIHILVLF